MATRLQGVAYSLEENAKYDVYIDDGAPSTGTIPAIEVAGISITHQAASKDIDANLMLSKAKVVFRVQNSTQEAVFGDMSGAEELRFRVRITKDNSLYYVGFVLLDLLTIDDDSGDYNLTIEATDGIGRLKSIDYDGGGQYYDDYETVLDHINTILAAVPLSDYYGANDEYLVINANLWPNGLTPDGTTDQLNLIRCSYRAFRAIDNRGNVKFSSYYDVLLEICKAFGLRFMYSNGRYVLADIVDYARTTGSVRFLRYDINGNALSAQVLGGGGGTQWTAWTRESGELSEYLAESKSIVTRAGGKITALPALKAVNWVYEHYSKQNTLPAGEVWTNGSNPTPGIQNFVTAPGLRLRVNAAAQLEIVPPTGQSFTDASYHVVVGMRLWVFDPDDLTGKSLNRTYNIVASQATYTPDEWVDGISGINYPFVFRISPNVQGSVSNQITTLTAEVPISGTLRIQFFIIDVLKNGTTWTGADVNYNIFNPYIETFIEGSVTDQYNYSAFEANNDAFTNNSAVIDRTARLGDGPTENSFGRFEYFNGTVWPKTNLWRRYAGGAYQDVSSRLHGSVRARDILSLQDQPRRKISGTLILRDYSVEYLYLRAGKRYLPYKADHDLITDRVKGDWIEIASQPASASDPTENPSDQNPIDGETGGGSPVPDTTGPDIGGGGPVTGESEVPPGQLVPGLTTVNSGLDTEVEADVPADTIPVTATPSDLPLFTGDIIVITNPITGAQQTLTVAYDSEQGIPTADQVAPPPPAFPYYTENGIVWLTPDDTNVAVEDFTPTTTFPADSFLQFNAAYLTRLRALLRRDHVDANIFGFAEDLTTGLASWFWRPTARIGWHISRVQFAFAQDMTGSAKINLKYYDATGFKYTIATYDGGGLGGVIAASADVLEGYYRVEVETITGTAPKGLFVTIELIKILP